MHSMKRQRLCLRQRKLFYETQNHTRHQYAIKHYRGPDRSRRIFLRILKIIPRIGIIGTGDILLQILLIFKIFQQRTLSEIQIICIICLCPAVCLLICLRK